jgi:hypothetical protein
MTQPQLIIEYIKQYGSILPAKVAGLVYNDHMLGSETSKRCRELRAKGVLRSEQEGKFERFYLTETKANYGDYKNVSTFDVEKWNEQFKRVEVKEIKQALF